MYCTFIHKTFIPITIIPCCVKCGTLNASLHKRADNLLKLGRHQLKMVVAILTRHASVEGRLRTMGLFNRDPSCRFCGMETETVQHITCCCESLARQHYVLGNCLLNQKK